MKGPFLNKNRFLIHILNLSFWLWFLTFFILEGDIADRLFKIFGGIFFFVLSYIIVALIDWLLGSEFVFRRKIPGVLRNIIKFVLLFIFVLGILHYHFKLEITGISITSAVLAGILGFALQETLGNLLSGIAINMDSPFKHGDWVRVGEDEGWVIDISWRSTTIHTREDDIIILPNSMVSSSRIVNYSRPQRWKALSVEVGVAYHSSPDRVKELMTKAALDSRYVRKEPIPVCWLISFEDFSVIYEVKFWVKDYADAHESTDDVRTKIWYSFRRNGIEIPFPIRVIKNPEIVDTCKEDKTIEIFNILRSTAIFEPLDDPELKLLSERVKRVVFGKGDIVIKQGDEGDSMFVVTGGKISVELRTKDGKYKRIGEMGYGGIVGEMSLMTGEVRTATVRALTEVEMVVISKVAFAQILIKKPEITDKFSTLLAKRKEELDSKRSPEVVGDVSESEQHDKYSILYKMQNFFGLTRK